MDPLSLIVGAILMIAIGQSIKHWKTLVGLLGMLVGFIFTGIILTLLVGIVWIFL